MMTIGGQIQRAKSQAEMQPLPASTGGFEDLCLKVFFWFARHASWGPRLTGPMWVRGAWLASASMREAVRSNVRRILGPSASKAEVDRLGRRVVASFYRFVCEVGRAHVQSRDDIAQRIAAIDNKEPYLAARRKQRGAVLVTAHFGNFEVGLVALRQIEARIHVVFQRDRMGTFERIRSAFHRRIDVIETPIDDGMAGWLAMRDALQDDAVVLLQGDRLMPGQRGQAVPFFDGHLELPVGPAKLAMMTGAPLVPVFAVRVDGSKVKIVLGQPIEVPDAGAVPEAVEQTGRAIESMIRAHPEQWHVLHRPWVEDRQAS